MIRLRPEGGLIKQGLNITLCRGIVLILRIKEHTWRLRIRDKRYGSRFIFNHEIKSYFSTQEEIIPEAFPVFKPHVYITPTWRRFIDSLKDHS